MSRYEPGWPVKVQPQRGNPFLAEIINELEDGFVMVRAADDGTTLSYEGKRVYKLFDGLSLEDARSLARGITLEGIGAIVEHPRPPWDAA